MTGNLVISLEVAPNHHWVLAGMPYKHVEATLRQSQIYTAPVLTLPFQNKCPLHDVSVDDVKNKMVLKVLHILLAFNVLLSTTGVTMFEHLCQIKGRTASVFAQPKNCCQKKERTKLSSACKKTKCCKKAESIGTGTHINKKNCCEDKSQFFKSEADVASAKTISVPDFKSQPLFADAFNHTTRFDIIPLNQKIRRYYLYKPPPLVLDIRVLVQSFLC